MDPHETDRALETLLERSRPEPEAAWVRATGERLFAPRRSWLPGPTLRMGSALAGGIAALALGLSVAGVGPLGSGSEPVRANDDCRTVTVTRSIRMPSLVTVDGDLRVVYTRKPVRRSVRRCG
jgi:hypothetical protein